MKIKYIAPPDCVHGTARQPFLHLVFVSKTVGLEEHPRYLDIQYFELFEVV